MRPVIVSRAGAIVLAVIQSAVGQSTPEAEVLAALAERDKAYLAGDEAKVAQPGNDHRVTEVAYYDVASLKHDIPSLPGLQQRCHGSVKLVQPRLLVSHLSLYIGLQIVLRHEEADRKARRRRAVGPRDHYSF